MFERLFQTLEGTLTLTRVSSQNFPKGLRSSKQVALVPLLGPRNARIRVQLSDGSQRAYFLKLRAYFALSESSSAVLGTQST